jgi:Zn-dependent peptidase ImmA (M78 family)
VPTKKLSEEQRRELILRALDGESPTKLEREYGVSRQYIIRLRNVARANAAKEKDFAEKVFSKSS